jgi:hypothetical protein
MPDGDRRVDNMWNVQQNLASTDAGFNYTAAADIKVAPDAASGNRKVTVTIVPDRGKRTTRTLVYQVTEKRR